MYKEKVSKIVSRSRVDKSMKALAECNIAHILEIRRRTE